MLPAALKYSVLDDRFDEDSSPTKQMKRRSQKKKKLTSHNDILGTWKK